MPSIVRIFILNGSLITQATKSCNPSELFCELAISCLVDGDYRCDVLWTQSYYLGEIPSLPEMAEYGHADMKVILFCSNCNNRIQIWPIPDRFLGYLFYAFNPTLPFFIPRTLRYFADYSYTAHYPNNCCQYPKLRLFFHLTIIFDPEHLRIGQEAQQILEKYPRGI